MIRRSYDSPVLGVAAALLLVVGCTDDDTNNPYTGTDTGADTATGDVGADMTADGDDGSDATDDTAAADAAPGPLEVVGTYDDAWGGFLGVTTEGVRFGWYADPFMTITRFDNDENWLVGQNTDADEWNPGKWSRVDWVVTEDGVMWCQTVYDAETEDDALSAASADSEDPDAGCAGFAWSMLTPGQGPVAIAGSWIDGFDGTHAVSSETWDMAFALFHVDSFDNDAEHLVAQNDADNEFSAGLWSRFDWTRDDEGGFWFCQTAYDAADAAAAESVPRSDDTNPAEGGCSGFAWSSLAPASE